MIAEIFEYVAYAAIYASFVLAVAAVVGFGSDD